ncbi:MAG TPA: helix-turn-helix transcriptional regulator [Candidatus Polarisedimenticolia bacterium]|nr:helix-turn-helix transcriptional regulator [Candidatus Polarisedimenticolia bacterium]
MPAVPRDDVQKKEIGARIKHLRKQAGLRQWQLAEMIGATQPAIHMYERGVLPEPKRLLELARIGRTTVEWILTGRHWEDGSEEMQRVPADVCALAARLSGIDEEDRKALSSALQIINAAVESLKRHAPSDVERLPLDEIARLLKESAAGSLDAVAAALRIHEAVTRVVLSAAADRLKSSPAYGSGDAESRGETSPEGRRRPPVNMRSASLEPLRGNIYRIEGSLLVIQDIIKDRTLRAELEETLTRLGSKLESKKNRVVKLRKAHRGK